MGFANFPPRAGHKVQLVFICPKDTHVLMYIYLCMYLVPLYTAIWSLAFVPLAAFTVFSFFFLVILQNFHFTEPSLDILFTEEGNNKQHLELSVAIALWLRVGCFGEPTQQHGLRVMCSTIADGLIYRWINHQPDANTGSDTHRE